MMIEDRIRTKLANALSTTVLDVVNESGAHAVPPDSETHFRVLLVSDEFEGHSRVNRHRTIHRLLAEELRQGVHALAIDAWTPAEWTTHDQKPSLSPRCMGGDSATG